MRYMSMLRLAVSCTIILPVYATKPLSLQHVSFHQVRQSFSLVLPGLQSASPVGVNSLVFEHQHVDKRHIAHIHLQQKYEGYPVFGGYAVIHNPQSAHYLLKSNPKVTMNGIVYEELEATLGRPSPDFINRGAVALEQFKHHFSQATISEETVKPLVYIQQDKQAYWAYQVSLLVNIPGQTPKRPTMIMEAKTFQSLLEWNALPTIRLPVYGFGFGGNERIGSYQFGKEKPILNIKRDPILAKCFMENNNVKVIDMRHQYSGVLLPMHFDCQEDEVLPENTFWTGYERDGYDQDNGAYSPANDALYVGGVIYNMYEEWFGIPVLKTIKDTPMKLVMRVHYGWDFENAFWDGRYMTFGDGHKLMHPLVSIGIGAHEISHGFTEQNSNLQYVGQPGGINEAFSDMAAQAAEHYAIGENSWTIGAEIMKRSSAYRALRFMKEPSRDGHSIDRADQYYEGLDVHYSSGVYNRLFYILATQPEWDVKRAFQVMLKANMDYWTPYSNFVDAGCGILNAANDLGFSLEAVKYALEKVLIHAHTCAVMV